MLFRIEDVAGFDPNLREYSSGGRMVEKAGIDRYIAEMIREEVNGADKREALSYSRSLAVCLLKYNKGADNELHICKTGGSDYIWYVSHRGKEKAKPYSIWERERSMDPLFRRDGKIELRGFVIDVSDNAVLDRYLRRYTGTGKNPYASPEKDYEVVVRNPPGDQVVYVYMDALYALYALQMKYRFLSDAGIKSALLSDMMKDEHCFMGAPQEQEAFVSLIHYLSKYWEYEQRISGRIYRCFEREEHLSFCFDGILQFDCIQKNSFQTARDLLLHYNAQPLLRLFWEYCQAYLDKLPEALRNEIEGLQKEGT